MRNKSKFLFFSFFLIITIQIFFAIPIYSNAETSNLSIKANWLSVQTSGFVDVSPNPYENDLFTEIGGYDLIAFENLGLMFESTTDEVLVYGGRITFGFEVNAFTAVDFRDMYPKININSKYSSTYFGLSRYKLSGAYYSDYSFSYSQIDYGSIHVPHEYNGYIPLTVSMKELTPTSGSITIGGTTLDTPEYIFDIMEVDTKSVYMDVVGQYEDRFIGINNIDEGKVNFAVQADLLPQQSQVVKWCQSAGIGWKAGTVQNGRHLQQYIRYGDGSTFQNPNPNIDKSYTFNVGMKLKPSAYEYVQYNTITKASIILWEWGLFAGCIDVVSGPATSSLKRVVAVHVINHRIHWDYSVDVYVYATIPSTAEITETVLNSPALQFGNFVWDTSITGDYEVEVPIIAGSMLLELLPWIIGIVVIVVIIAVIVVIFKFTIVGSFFKKGKEITQQPTVKININK